MPTAPAAPAAPLPADVRAWRWRIFGATWLAYAGYYFCRKPFSIVKSSMGKELGFDAPALADIGAAYLLAYALGQFIAGWAGNRWGPRLVLLGGMGVSLSIYAVFGFSNSYGTFLALNALNGLVQATGWSAGIGTMAAWFHRGERGAVMGWWTTNFQVGGVLANTAAAYVLGAMGWRYSFFAGSAALLLVWLVVLAFQRNKPEDLGFAPIDDPTPDGATSAASATSATSTASEGLGWTRDTLINIGLVGAIYFFLKFIRYALWSWAPFFLERNFGLKGDDAGYLSTLFDVAGIPSVVVIGWLSDRFFQSRRAIVCFWSLLILVLTCGVMMLAGQTSVAVFAACLTLIGFTLYGPDALLTGAGAMDLGSKRGATLAAGLISGVGSLGSVLQELVIARAYKADASNLGPIFAMLFASGIAATLFTGALLYRNRGGRGHV